MRAAELWDLCVAARIVGRDERELRVARVQRSHARELVAYGLRLVIAEPGQPGTFAALQHALALPGEIPEQREAPAVWERDEDGHRPGRVAGRGHHDERTIAVYIAA